MMVFICVDIFKRACAAVQCDKVHVSSVRSEPEFTSILCFGPASSQVPVENVRMQRLPWSFVGVPKYHRIDWLNVLLP